MMQLALPLAAPRARRTDPTTSHDAAARAARFAGGHWAKILAALRQHGPMTAEQMFTFTGLTVVQVDRRMPELASGGMARVQHIDGIEQRRAGFRVWEAC